MCRIRTIFPVPVSKLIPKIMKKSSECSWKMLLISHQLQTASSPFFNSFGQVVSRNAMPLTAVLVAIHYGCVCWRI